MKSDRRNDWLVVLAALLPATGWGCHGTAICEPPWTTSGQLVKLRNSDAYLQRMEQAGGDVPHLACRAEATIPMQQLYLRESDPASYAVGPGVMAKNSTVYDPRVHAPRQDISKLSGEYRVMGVGRGIAAEDCAQAAMQACNDAIDGYWRKQRAVPPLAVPCRLLADKEACPSSGSYEPLALAPAEPKLAPRSEPPLIGLIKKLDASSHAPRRRARAVQFFDNAKSRAHGDVGDSAVRALLDKIVEPLAGTYAGADLDDSTRGELVRVLGEAGDARAGRAWSRAFTSFAAGKPGFEDDVGWSAQGVALSRHRETAAALGEAFVKIEVGTPEGVEPARRCAPPWWR